MVVQQEADIEFPADDHAATAAAEFDGRLTMHDVILAKKDVKRQGVGSANYPLNASVTTAAFGPVTVMRGYNVRRT